MNAVATPIDEIANEARSFRERCKTLHLATCTSTGIPTASYAPYGTNGRGGFYIYVSELAAHTNNLRGGCAPSVMFIEAESECATVFARKRLTYTCDIRYLARGGTDFDDAIESLRARFGDVMDHLATLQDFHAFELLPRHASYVRGFGQAYEFPHADFSAARHRNDQGHRDA